MEEPRPKRLRDSSSDDDEPVSTKRLRRGAPTTPESTSAIWRPLKTKFNELPSEDQPPLPGGQQIQDYPNVWLTPQTTPFLQGFAMSPTFLDRGYQTPYDPNFGTKVQARMRLSLTLDRDRQQWRIGKYGQKCAEDYSPGQTPIEVREDYEKRLQEAILSCGRDSDTEDEAETDKARPTGGQDRGHAGGAEIEHAVCEDRKHNVGDSGE